MNAKVTAADVLLRAAEIVDEGSRNWILYLGAIKAAVEETRASDKAWEIANNAAKNCEGEHMTIQPRRVRVLALLFARELILRGDV